MITVSPAITKSMFEIGVRVKPLISKRYSFEKETKQRLNHPISTNDFGVVIDLTKCGYEVQFFGPVIRGPDGSKYLSCVQYYQAHELTHFDHAPSSLTGFSANWKGY